MRFEDRKDAGRCLAGEYEASLADDIVVCGLPRGGVVVAAEVAKQLGVHLGIINVKKIVHPNNSEYAIGALAEGCDPIINKQDADLIDEQLLLFQVSLARRQIRMRREKYATAGITTPELHDKTVIIIDDGSATGLTMEAAIAYARRHNARRVEVGLPVAPRDVVQYLETKADTVVTILVPRFFAGSVGAYYKWFDQVDDAEVMRLLREAHHVYETTA